MKKNILFSIGIMIITGLSLVWLVQNVPVIEYVGNNKELNKENEFSNFTNDIPNEIILGAVGGNGSHQVWGGPSSKIEDEDITVSTYDSYSEYSCESCSGWSCKSSTLVTNDVDKITACANCKESCYRNQYQSDDGVFSTTITTGEWLMTDGDYGSCTIGCVVYQEDYPYSTITTNCPMNSGPCSGGLISSPGASRRYTMSVSYGSKTHYSTLNIQYCAGGWHKWPKTAYVANRIGATDAVYSKSLYRTTGSCVAAKAGGVSAYKCVPDAVEYRCSGFSPLSVCVYKPSSVPGKTSFEYADGYKWTDDPDEYTSKGWLIDENKTKSQCGGCFGNATTLAQSTHAAWGEGEHGVTGYKLDEVPSNQCKASDPLPPVCDPLDQNGSPTESLKTEKCEEEKNVFYIDGKWCTGEPFYEIKCVNKYANTFDIEGEDVTVDDTLDIKQGVSVGMEIKTVGTKLCSSNFYAETWKKVYRIYIQKFKELDIEKNSIRNKADVDEWRYWYITHLTEVLDQINKYLEWKVKNEHEPTVQVQLKNASGALQKLNSPRGEGGQTVINFEYKPCTSTGEGKDDPNNSDICIPRCKFNDFDDPNCFPKYGKMATDEGDFTATLQAYKEDIEYDSEKKEHLINIEDYGVKFDAPTPNFSGITLAEHEYVETAMPSDTITIEKLNKVKNFMWYTQDKDEVTLIPPKVSLNWLSGEVLGSTTPRKVVDGYNRLYTDEEAEKGEQFKLEVHLENIGSSKSRVFDNICKLNVVETELTYRTIEETNPFINESRKKGYNWYRNGMDGTLYDFTKVIQGGGGYSASYEFSRDAIKSVKASNASLGKEAYLGACYLGLDSTSAICSN